MVAVIVAVAWLFVALVRVVIFFAGGIFVVG